MLLYVNQTGKSIGLYRIADSVVRLAESGICSLGTKNRICYTNPECSADRQVTEYVNSKGCLVVDKWIDREYHKKRLCCAQHSQVTKI
jgi:hypothetical protein